MIFWNKNIFVKFSGQAMNGISFFQLTSKCGQVDVPIPGAPITLEMQRQCFKLHVAICCFLLLLFFKEKQQGNIFMILRKTGIGEYKPYNSILWWRIRPLILLFLNPNAKQHSFIFIQLGAFFLFNTFINQRDLSDM